MKTWNIIVLVACATVAAFLVGRRNSAPARVVVVAPHPALSARPPATTAPRAPQAGSPATPVTSEGKVDEAGLALASALETFTSPHASFAQRQAVLDQLRKGGRLDDAIATLKQLAAQNPGDPTIPTALGEAQISQIRYLYETGANPDANDIAILGLQADRNFTAALALDPANWEAQFEKAAAMTRWPPALAKGPEVLDRLSALVTQQEAAPAPQPEFAQTYALLGEQYQAAGQPDKAAQIWRQGLGRFPLSAALQRDLAPPAAH